MSTEIISNRQNVDGQNADQTVCQQTKCRIFIFLLGSAPHTWYFPAEDIQTSPTLSFAPVLIEDAQCAESNEKSIFRFLFSELSGKFIENWGVLNTKMTITR